MIRTRYNVLITRNPGTRRASECFEMFDDEASARSFVAANAKEGDAVQLTRMAVQETSRGLWRPIDGGEFRYLKV